MSGANRVYRLTPISAPLLPKPLAGDGDAGHHRQVGVDDAGAVPAWHRAVDQ